MNHDDIDYDRLRWAATFVRRATIAILATMFIGTHLPAIVTPEFTYIDKLVHFSAYTTLAFAVLVSWELNAGPLQPPHLLAVALACGIYGVFDELTQIPVHRTCDIRDWIADMLGVSLGILLFRLVRPTLYRFVAKKHISGPTA